MRSIAAIACLTAALAACTESTPAGERQRTIGPVPPAPPSATAATPPILAEDQRPSVTSQPAVAGMNAAQQAADCVPSAERCNGLDDDCDGIVDDGYAVGTACTIGEGECAATGVVACAGDGRAICTADAAAPTFERCDGLDNDCDGATDESGDTETGNACGGCGPIPRETCNGIDDDCDGEIDEGFSVGAACKVGPGPICRTEGTVVCSPEGEGVCDFDLADLTDCARAQRDRVAVAKGATCTVVNGDLKCWGIGPVTDHLDALRPPALIDPLAFGTIVEQVAAGERHACIIDHAKQVRCWGEGTDGALGEPVPSGTSVGPRGATHPVVPLDMEVVSLALGDQSACAVGLDGAVKCWGDNSAGLLGDPADAALGDAPGEVASLPPIDLPLDAIQVVLGARHACALSARGRVVCWGQNDAGQLGLEDRVARIGTTLGAALPVVDLDMRVVELAAAGDHTCALDDLGRVRCWGTDATGALNGFAGALGGEVGQMGVRLPIIPLPEPAISVATSIGETCAVGVSGALWCWGRATVPEDVVHPVKRVDLGEPVVRAVPGAGFGCALTGEGALKCWGENAHGQLGQGDAIDREAAADLAPVLLE